MRMPFRDRWNGGVFENFPSYRVVLTEGGTAWITGLMWRLDAEWKALRTEAPWVKRRPSDYLCDHVRFSAQPLERPEDDRHCLQMLEMRDIEYLLGTTEEIGPGARKI